MHQRRVLTAVRHSQLLSTPPFTIRSVNGIAPLRSLSQTASSGPPNSDGDDSTTHARRKAFLPFRRWVDDPEGLRQNAVNRKMPFDADDLVNTYSEYRATVHEIETFRARRNNVSKGIQDLVRAKADKQTIQEHSAEAKRLKAHIATLEDGRTKLDDRLYELGQLVPNETHPDVPIGPEENAKLVNLGGRKPEFNFEPQDHIQLGELHNLFDFRAGAEVAGSSFYFLRGAAALLEMALTQYAFHKLVGKGYTPVTVPDIVRAQVAEACGFRPRDPTSSQIYRLADQHNDGLGARCLAGTAEILLAGMHMDQTLHLDELPLKYVGVGHAFRCEAGGAGQATRGLYRVHQFTKVEMFAFAPPDEQQSSRQFDEMVAIQEEMFLELGLHYRVLDMPTEELGAPAYRKFDIEAWMPGRNAFGEISSTSNCTDYQSRRLNIRTKDANTESQSTFVHTLNGTACAVPRMIIALLETHQDREGNILLPEVLWPYLGFRTITAPRKHRQGGRQQH